MRLQFIAATLLSLSACTAEISSPVDQILSFYSKPGLPIHIIRTAQYKEDINKLDVDPAFVKSVFEKRFKYTFDGEPLSESFNRDYIQTLVTYTRKDKSTAACLIRIGEDFYASIYRRAHLEGLLVVAHEAGHCHQLSSFLKRDQYQSALPGVRYLRNTEITQEVRSKKISKREGIFLLKYSEYIREVAADISSLLYLRHQYRASDEAIQKALDHLLKKRGRKNIHKYPNSVGHKTTLFLEKLTIKLLDSHMEEFQRDTFLASMKIAYSLDRSFTFDGFKEKYGHLALTTNHF
ncbi:hypothetical protein IOQ59_11015 [Pontibacterium sp. N1Y112]|uniref:Uncharacterized protein n=1 Tax=Pontibacterium sinense TaxID=2781979 RepID=A0A8J7FB91_9GAMM|nr:hypothetical protein [Pontibacterium sinense]MBE9397787.1 hypothetical protein [Pontibacterium sinense]